MFYLTGGEFDNFVFEVGQLFIDTPIHADEPAHVWEIIKIDNDEWVVVVESSSNDERRWPMTNTQIVERSNLNEGIRHFTGLKTRSAV